MTQQTEQTQQTQQTQQTEQRVITIDNAVYDIASIPEDVLRTISDMTTCDKEIKELTVKRGIAEAARTLFATQLKTLLKEVTPLEVLETQEDTQEDTPT